MPEIQKVRYTHDALVDVIVANPAITQREMAATFGYTEAWMSIIINSDAFQERLAARKSEIVDPIIRESLDAKFRAVADVAARTILDKLHATGDAKLAIRALEVTSRALGYGAKAPSQTMVNVTPVVIVPAKETSSDAWAAQFGGEVVEGAAYEAPSLEP